MNAINVQWTAINYSFSPYGKRELVFYSDIIQQQKKEKKQKVLFPKKSIIRRTAVVYIVNSCE